MPRYNPTERDIIHTLQTEIRALNKRVRQLENAPHLTTQFYTMGSSATVYPAEPPEGMIFINDSDQLCWVVDEFGAIRGVTGTLL